MKKHKVLLIILGFIVLIIIIGVVWFMLKQLMEANEIKDITKEQLEQRFHRPVTVTNVDKQWTENGSMYDVKVKLQGVNGTYEIGGYTGEFYNLWKYEVIDDIWHKQFTKEMKKMFNTKGFKLKYIDADATVPENIPIDISKLPTIQEVRKEYGQKFVSNDIQVTLQTKYPETKKGQLEENKKIFTLLKEMEKRGIARNLYLVIEYSDFKQIYVIGVKDPKTNPYHKPEDLNKAKTK
ncbi:hypothetical protein JOD45_001680 [Scopulibacillus daqui]|uniref:TATA-box binding protein n=1 Tax=Scopulibacillus daqui TaxID=1469162 RepID=A0ABS2Q198_9BACL|nr:hypothetical protein [Scopulibacillus daqui]MBM7645469.1 hypothetical protein [Scopulibacillus daqui]